LQVLNHLQDCAGDLRDLDRCYLPQDWMAEAGAATDDLARNETVPSLRAVFDRMLAQTALLNQSARALPAQVRARRLRVETAVIASLARRLTARLQGDPLATRVKLRKSDFFLAAITSLGRLL
jgi:farnesyl-diphosphate farnesyltransferase